MDIFSKFKDDIKNSAGNNGEKECAKKFYILNKQFMTYLQYCYDINRNCDLTPVLNDYLKYSKEIRDHALSCNYAPNYSKDNLNSIVNSNPIVSLNTNPIVNSTPNPFVNFTSNSIVNSNLNPIFNSNLNPIVQPNVNPIVNSTTNPIVQSNPNPIVNTNPLVDPISDQTPRGQPPALPHNLEPSSKLPSIFDNLNAQTNLILNSNNNFNNINDKNNQNYNFNVNNSFNNQLDKFPVLKNPPILNFNQNESAQTQDNNRGLSDFPPKNRKRSNAAEADNDGLNIFAPKNFNTPQTPAQTNTLSLTQNIFPPFNFNTQKESAQSNTPSLTPNIFPPKKFSDKNDSAQKNTPTSSLNIFPPSNSKTSTDSAQLNPANKFSNPFPPSNNPPNFAQSLFGTSAQSQSDQQPANSQPFSFLSQFTTSSQKTNIPQQTPFSSIFGVNSQLNTPNIFGTNFLNNEGGQPPKPVMPSFGDLSSSFTNFKSAPTFSSNLFSGAINKEEDEEDDGQEDPPIPESTDMGYEKNALCSIRSKLYFKNDDKFCEIGVGIFNIKPIEDKPNQFQLVFRIESCRAGNILMNIKVDKNSKSIQLQKDSNLLITSVPNPPIHEIVEDISKDSFKTVTYLVKTKTSSDMKIILGLLKDS